MKANLTMTAALIISSICIVGQAQAQTKSDPGQMLPGGEWAVGRWDGTLVGIGTSAGNAGLSQSPRTLIVQKNEAGVVTCLWFITNDPKSAQWTKNCKVGPNGISLETAAASTVEMSRSGQDALQGRFVPKHATGASGAGMSGQQVHLNRAR